MQEQEHISPQEALHTRVAVLEVTVTMLRAEFNSVKNVIINTGIAIITAFIGLLIAANAYFLKQKDHIIARLDAVIHQQEMRR